MGNLVANPTGGAMWHCQPTRARWVGGKVRPVDYHGILILAAVLLLGSCTTQTAPQSLPTILNSTPSGLAPASTVSQTPTVASTQTLDTTLCAAEGSAVPTLQLPETIADDFFFGGSKPDDCKLPCWHGLKVDSSGRKEIEDVFDRVLGLNGSVDVFACSPLEAISPSPISKIQGLYAAGYRWRFEPSGILTVAAWTDEDTYLLRGLEFDWLASEGFRVHLSPQRIIRELGQPSYWMLNIVSTERADIGSIDSLMVYNDGMAFWHSGTVPIALQVNEAKREFEAANAEFCLDQEFGTGKAYILEPFTHGLDSLTVLQEAHIKTLIQGGNLVPIQEFLGVSVDDVVSQAMQQDGACFYADMLKR